MTMRNEISEEEAKLYDRQIRLWGFEAQQKLKIARVLVVNMKSGVQHEIVKNLLLAGINHIDFVGTETIIFDRSLCDRVPFLFWSGTSSETTETSETSDGSVICVERALSACRELNPRAQVRAFNMTFDKLKQSANGIDGYSLILYDSADLESIRNIEAVCIKKQILFYAVHTFGMVSFAYNNLGAAHKYKFQRSIPSLDKTVPPQTIQVEEILHYFPIANSFNYNVKNVAARQLGRQLSPLLVILQAYLESRIASKEEFAALVADFCEKRCIPQNFVSDDEISLFWSGRNEEFNPVCTVTGGLVGQDIINAISHRNTPFKNWLIFDASKYAANMYDLSKFQ